MKILTFFLMFICFGNLCAAQECLIRCEPNLDGTGGAMGTGFFIEQSKVLTAYHVVENENKVRIEFDNGYYVAKVLKFDKDKDLALLKAECKNYFYKISDQEGVVDQEVFCRGFPKGTWTRYKSDGKIKDITKVRLKGGSKFSERYSAWMKVINGMSGGPLLTKDEKVIGVLSTKSVNGPVRANFVSWKEIKEFLNE